MKEWQSGSEDGGEEDRRPLLGDPESGSCHIQQYPLPTPAAKGNQPTVQAIRRFTISEPAASEIVKAAENLSKKSKV
ncbi:Hypothetical predicted protein [Pelobates cultripes]|nr:Hypothetical predicted protein [Pelobates cultripes]